MAARTKSKTAAPSAEALPAPGADLAPELVAALVAAVGKKFGAEAELPEGDHAVQGVLSLRINAIVSKGPSQVARPAVRLDAVRAIAAALAETGVELGQVERLALKAVSAAGEETVGAKATQFRDLVAAVAERHKERLTATLPWRDVAGPVRVTGSVTIEQFAANG